jgi:hypothetical protein
MASLEVEETKDRVQNGGSGQAGSNNLTNGGSSSLLWSFVAFIMLASTLLYACDMLEFRHDATKFNGISSSTAAAASVPFTGGSVVMKYNNKNDHDGGSAKNAKEPTVDVKKDLENNSEAESKQELSSAPEDHTTTSTITKTHVPSLGAGTPTRHTYTRRGQPISDDARKTMIEKWGSWTLVDEKKDQRPKDDFYVVYPNRDVPRKEFPSNAWQVDQDYLAKFVPEGLKMITRAYNAILAEYGLDDEDLKFFHVEKFDKFPDVKGHICLHLGGCTTKLSWDNLKRRLLHAIMTEDVFVFAMGGHSSAAGVSLLSRK